MRKKELKLVLTFHTTADAMAMEKACKEQNAPGRLIPVPRAISAGCGLAWDLISGEKHDFGGGSELRPYSAFFWKCER